MEYFLSSVHAHFDQSLQMQVLLGKGGRKILFKHSSLSCPRGTRLTTNRLRCSKLLFFFFKELNLDIISSTQSYFTQSSSKNLMDYLCISLLRYQDQLTSTAGLYEANYSCCWFKFWYILQQGFSFCLSQFCASIQFLALQNSIILIVLRFLCSYKMETSIKIFIRVAQRNGNSESRGYKDSRREKMARRRKRERDREWQKEIEKFMILQVWVNFKKSTWQKIGDSSMKQLKILNFSLAIEK